VGSSKTYIEIHKKQFDMSVITLLERAQRINNAMPARMAQRPQVSETVIPEKEFITVKQGEVSAIAREKYNLILANINRNILLSDIPAYAQSLLPQGVLLVSGFYLEDLPAIQECSQAAGLRYISHIERNNWVSAKFQRI